MSAAAKSRDVHDVLPRPDGASLTHDDRRVSVQERDKTVMMRSSENRRRRYPRLSPLAWACSDHRYQPAPRCRACEGDRTRSQGPAQDQLPNHRRYSLQSAFFRRAREQPAKRQPKRQAHSRARHPQIFTHLMFGLLSLTILQLLRLVT